MKLPLYEQLYRFVLGEIAAGRWAPGARVPSEKELAQQFHVSRITSKHALEKLANDGMIQRTRGRGSFVADTKTQLSPVPTSTAVAGKGTEPLVGLVIPDMSDAFGAELVRTIEWCLREHSLRTILCRTMGRRELEEKAIDDCLALGVAGLIIFPVYGQYYNERLLRLVLDRFPLVLVDRYLRGIPACSVCTDNRRAVEDLVNHLIEQGHDHFALISLPPAGTSSIEDRILGMMATIAEHGLHFNADEDIIYTYCTLPGALTPTTQNIGHDLDTIRAYVLAHPEVTAYVACEYPMALLVQRVLAGLGRTVPSECAIACFDAPYTALDGVHFTYIQQDEGAMGAQAVELLLAQIRQGEVPLYVAVPHTLMRGRTS